MDFFTRNGNGDIFRHSGLLQFHRKRFALMQLAVDQKHLFQYFLIVIILLWPALILGFVFLRWLYLKVGSFLGGSKRQRPATSPEKGEPKPVENVIGIS